MHQRQLGGLWAAFVSAIVGTIVITACGGGGGGSDTEHREMPSARGGGGNGGGGGGGGSSAGVALTADARVRSLDLGWSDNGASQYNVYLSSSPNCDIAKYTLCADGQMLANVRPPLHVEGLVNGRAYYAKVEGIYSKTRSVSNEAGTKPNSLAFNDSVWALATAADGTTYLGGDFTKIGITSGQGMTLDATSGRPSVAGFPVIGGGGVIAATPDGSGGWYIGGDFLRVGTTSKKYLAHMRADGSLDANWTPQPDGTVRTIAVMNGVVYVGGTFSTINGQKRIGLAAIDAAGGFLTAWNPDPDLGVWTIAAANNTIYVGGPFNTVGAFRRGYLAAIDTFGNVLAWDPTADNSVEALAFANGIVYAGGFFESVSGQPRAKLAAIDAASGKPTAWNPGSQPCATCDVKAIAMVGNTLYVGGRFTQIGSTPRNALAAIDAASGSVLAWNPDADQTVQSLSVLNDATRGTIVYAGGMFSTIGGQPRSYLAAIDAQGALLPWQPAPNATVDVVAAAGNAVYAGGRFTGLGAVTRNRLAALDAKGNLTTWNPDADQSVLAFAISRDTIYVGGNFTTLGGQPRAHIALVDTAGSVSAWNPGTDGAVRAFAVGGSGNVYVGGEFTHIAGAMFNRLAAIGPTGALLGWTPNADRPVLALAVRPDTGQGESVYAGGQFSMINGQNRRRVAQIDAQGQPMAWSPWGFETVGDLELVDAMVYANGNVYVGGNFTRLGASLGKISESGAVLPFRGTNARVWSLALSGNTLYFGGEFTSVLDPVGPPVPRQRLAAIDIGNGALTAWDANIDNGAVYALSAAGGAVHAAGSFTQLGGQVTGGYTPLAP